MAYCRIDDTSDVYVYGELNGYAIHARLPNGFGEDAYVVDATEALEKLAELSANGVRVPERAIRRLQEDAADGL